MSNNLRSSVSVSKKTSTVTLKQWVKKPRGEGGRPQVYSHTLRTLHELLLKLCEM
jgi:hypothetical protein